MKYFFEKSPDYSSISKIAIAGVILSFAIIISYLSRFIPNLFGFLGLNFSLIPILFGFYVVGWGYGWTILIANFIITPLLISGGGLAIDYLGRFTILVVQSAFIVTQIYSFKFLYQKQKNKNGFVLAYNCYLASGVSHPRINLQIQRHHYNYLWINIVSYFVSTMLAMVAAIGAIFLVNTFFVNLIYLKLFWNIKPNLSTMLQNYQKTLRPLFLGISNYFLGSFVIYASFNLINLALNSVILTLIWILDWKTKIITNYKKKYNHYY
ncbi:MPN527 family putative ECF transporter permease subunit [Mycoplasmopsis sturni]|uniref:MPN527 family putative ECF transporter permease subunit n=1 Tax=Mycoplasmopsis sturni TaxID=39047 RepID=UPI00055D533B|nr:hypothetical protein [Mycoplasmopsis sturni]